MKLGGGIDLDKLLLNPVLFAFVLPSFQFFRGGGGVLFFGVSECKKASLWELTFEYHYNKFRKLTAYIMV